MIHQQQQTFTCYVKKKSRMYQITTEIVKKMLCKAQATGCWEIITATSTWLDFLFVHGEFKAAQTHQALLSFTRTGLS